jgi:hypothetical protein
MGKVTFACACAQSHLEASLSRTTDASPAADLLFEESGKTSIELPRGVYDLAYRAQGTPGTPFSLTVTGDATMTPVDRALPADGLAAGIRTLVVRALLVPVALGAFHAGAASAQDIGNAVNGGDGGRSSNARVQAEQALATVPNVSDVLRAGYYLSLQAASNSATGTATVAIENAAGSFSASFSLEAPLNETSGEARPVTLRGLANTGVASVGLHWFRWPRSPDVAAMRRLCEQALHKEDCDDDEFTSEKDRRAFVRLARSGGAPVVVNLHASAGPTPFTYVDRATLASASETKTEWSVGAGIGRYAPRMGYIAAEYEHQQQFDKGDSAQLCTLTGGASATSIFDCRNVVVGGPSSLAREVGALEWRWFLPGGRLAVNPSVARDFRGRVFSVDAPFYFLASSSAALAGGARATWRSDRPGVAIAIFVGAALHPTSDSRP